MKIKRLIFILILIVVSVIFIAIFVKMGIKENVSLRDSEIAIENYSLYSENILPTGSTRDDLQAAIDNATSGDTIILSDNIAYTSTSPSITIPEDKVITIRV